MTIASYVHVLMRDEKEGRKKQARSNKQQGKATQHTQSSHLYMYIHAYVHVCGYDIIHIAYFYNYC